ncbi:MAG: hypothetical protein HYV63_34450 [Candidatus Schekmanbacteria bacterium]|nr:hypothetical protein [Candidatus Schekmanbacteria bacterium]
MTAMVDYPIDKRQWRPSLIPGPIALVSTVAAVGAGGISGGGGVWGDSAAGMSGEAARP